MAGAAAFWIALLIAVCILVAITGLGLLVFQILKKFDLQ